MHVIRRWRSLLPRGELQRGLVALVGGATFAQALIVASAPIVTRLYSPSEVGVYSVASSLLSVLTVVTCLRYEWSIPLPESDVAAANALSLCLLISAALSILVGIVLWTAGEPLVGLVGASVLRPYVLLIMLGQAGGGVALAFTNWAIRTRAFSEIAATDLTQSATQAVAQVGLGLAHMGAIGLFVGAIAGIFTAATRLSRAAWHTHASAFRGVSWSGIRFAASRYRRFPIFSSGSALINGLGEQAPLLLLVAIYGTSVGGHFALAVRVSALPVSLIAGAVSQVYVSETARLAREDPAGLRAVFGRTIRSLALAAIGPFALLAVVAPLLAGPVFGGAWAIAGVYVALLVPMYYLQLVTSPTGGTLDVLERQDLHLTREVLRLCFVGVAALAADALHLTPVVAVGVFGVAGCLTYTVYGLASWQAIVSAPARRARSHQPPPGPSRGEQERTSSAREE
jgi:O-antigen/teichoic acid export membrane protein